MAFRPKDHTISGAIWSLRVRCDTCVNRAVAVLLDCYLRSLVTAAPGVELGTVYFLRPTWA